MSSDESNTNTDSDAPRHEHSCDEATLFIETPDLIEDENPGQPSGSSASDLETSYLHPTSLLFTLISQVRQNLIPAAIAAYGAAKGNYVLLVLAGLGFVITLAVAITRYLTLKYRIHDGELTVESGILFRRVRKVPTDQIQNIDIVQNVFHRLFKVAEVRVETASGKEPEATLRVLSLDQVQQLRDKVNARPQPQAVKSNPSELADSQPVPAESPVLTIPVWWLVKAGLASNRGMVLVGFLLGIWFQFNSEEGAWKQIQNLFSGFDFQNQTFWFWLSLVGIFLAALVLLRLLGIGWFLLRFFGYRLTRNGDDFRISCGMFTKVSATVPIRRIQFISIHRTLFMRWLGMASIRIETAGGAGGNQEDATTSVSKRWFIPAIPESEVSSAMAAIRGDLEWTESEFAWQPLAERAGARMVRIGIIISAFLILVGLCVSRPWGWVPGVALSPWILWYELRKSRSTKYTRLQRGIAFRSGVLTKKTSITFFDKIQSVTFEQSPFDRRWGMGSLAVDTAAAGPAGHRIDVRFLDAKFAVSECRAINRLASQQ